MWVELLQISIVFGAVLVFGICWTIKNQNNFVYNLQSGKYSVYFM